MIRSRSGSFSELAASTAVSRPYATVSTARLIKAENGLSTASTRRPSVRVLRSPRRSAPAPWFGLKFKAFTARSTRARVWGDTFASSFMTRDTVLVPTPANAATSRIVARTLEVDPERGVDIDVSFPIRRLLVYEFVNLQALTLN